MEIVRLVHAIKEVTRREARRGSKIGFVPTMGALHEGHLTLVRRVKEISDIVVVSVFVNPTQFAPGEDYESYPRDLARDADLCIAEGVDYLFAPQSGELYPPGHTTSVEVGELGERMEGKSRPGHFRGVTTVVLKLFEIVRPTVAAFGQKDAQQAIILQRMVRDLMLDVELVIVPTVRDEDGLALSSRNARLTPEQREAAAAIPRALEGARHVVAEGQQRPEEVIAAAREVLEAEPLLEVDYVELVDKERLRPVEAVRGEMLLAVAVRAGETRLIDNTIIRNQER
jgi:pantoate--beta-alanine ligase